MADTIGLEPVAKAWEFESPYPYQIIEVSSNGKTAASNPADQGSIPCASAKYAPLTQLVRVPFLYSGGRWFESSKEYQI